MTYKRKGRLPSDRGRKLLESAEKSQNELREQLKTALEVLPRALTKIAVEELPGQETSLLLARQAIDEALATNRRVVGTIGGAVGHLAEVISLLETDASVEILRNAMTIILTDRVFFQADSGALAAVVEVLNEAVIEQLCNYYPEQATKLKELTERI